MFTLLNCGTNDELTDILDFTLRTFPDCMAIEAGSVGQEEDVNGESGEARRRSKKRKSDAVECFGMLSEGLGRIADAIDRSDALKVLSVGAARAVEMENRLNFITGLA